MYIYTHSLTLSLSLCVYIKMLPTVYLVECDACHRQSTYTQLEKPVHTSVPYTFGMWVSKNHNETKKYLFKINSWLKKTFM